MCNDGEGKKCSEKVVQLCGVLQKMARSEE